MKEEGFYTVVRKFLQQHKIRYRTTKTHWGMGFMLFYDSISLDDLIMLNRLGKYYFKDMVCVEFNTNHVYIRFA